jgi:DNA polymerase sigma
LVLKKYLANRDCDKSFTGGISSFLLFYMVLAYYQNYSAKYLERNPNIPDIYKFLEFYSNLDESEYGLQIDLREIFPGDPFYASKSDTSQ